MKLKILIKQVWVNIVLHTQAKYQKDQIKTEGASSIFKKKLTGGRLGIG